MPEQFKELSTKRISIPIYQGTLRIYITNDVQQTLSHVGYDKEIVCDACLVYDDETGLRSYDMIFKEGYVNHGIIAHECFHLTMRVMDQVGKKYDVTNDEAEAYLIQFFIDEVYRFLKKHNIEA